MLTFVSGVVSQQVKDWNQIYIQCYKMPCSLQDDHRCIVNVDPRTAAASSYPSVAVQRCHQPRPGHQWSAFTHPLSGEVTSDGIFGKRRQKNASVFSVVMEMVKAINKKHREGPGSDGSSPESWMNPESPQSPDHTRVCRHDIKRPRACGHIFFSLQLFILLRLDAIKTPPSVIRVLNLERIGFHFMIPQQRSNQLCSSPRWIWFPLCLFNTSRGCKLELLLGSAVLQEGFFMFSPSSKCENAGNLQEHMQPTRGDTSRILYFSSGDITRL